jgi:hypothetical protein
VNREHKPAPEDLGLVQAPQGRIAGIPYDFRRPTLSKLRSRWWNPADDRVLTPKTFGLGWDINLYWIAHPSRRYGEKARG